MNTIKKGLCFKNSFMELEVLEFTQNEKSNVALLLSKHDGLYITVRNLQPYNGSYVWHWGHYYPNQSDAKQDYSNRVNELISD